MSSNLSLNYNKSNNNYNSYQTISVGSNIYVAGGVEYNGENLHTRGLNIYNEGDTVYNITGNILKEAGKNTIQESSNGRSIGLSLSKGANNLNNPLADKNTTAGINVSRNESEGEGVYYSKNSDITKGTSYYNNVGDVVIKGNELEIVGGFVRAEKHLMLDVEEIKINGSQDIYNTKGNSREIGVGKTLYGAKEYANVNVGQMQGKIDLGVQAILN